ncbi:MAG: hypothetical protein CDV28_10352 [Candidatus Electronema aureum]|uniref:Uncharacterized protein n=1 Tax=Candidatus Electronema aureum TaxID=2005002 RepID=A0A521G4A4_9BACT|nr:MAG: hypothetical protein CDV28_10352 [Candidatus Electronema aureum]
MTTGNSKVMQREGGWGGLRSPFRPFLEEAAAVAVLCLPVGRWGEAGTDFLGIHNGGKRSYSKAAWIREYLSIHIRVIKLEELTALLPQMLDDLFFCLA